MKSLDYTLLLGRLVQVVCQVLILPHSNSEEQVFSLVTKNNTPFRTTLGLDRYSYSSKFGQT